MKRLVALCLFLALTASAAAQETRITAVVNDEAVTVDDLASRMQLVMRSSGIEDTPANRQRLSARVLRSLIDEKLQMQEAKRLNVTVSEKDVNDALARIESQNNMPKGGLDGYLKQVGVSRASLVEQLSASIGWSKLVRNRLMQEVSISDEEVNEAMARLKANASQPQSRVAEIFLSIDNPSQEDEAKRLADRLIEQIRGGANFSAVAQQFSQSPTAAVGGDIGWVTPNQLGGLLGEAVEKMRPGEMSYPIRSSGGFYVLYVVERKTPGAANADDTLLALSQVVFPLPATATAEERQRVTAQAQNVSNTAKSCGEMSKIAHDQAPQLSGDIPEIRAGELPPEVRAAVLGLKVAEASQPLPLRGGVGVVMVCQRHEGANALPTRDEVTENLARERLDALARRYMRDLRRSAFVDIRG